MLVLTRKLQEAIKIGDNITLTVIKVKGNTVRLGIEAPRNVRILRTELPPDEVVDQASDETEPAPTDLMHGDMNQRPIVAEAVADFDGAEEFAVEEQPVPAPRSAPLPRVRRPRLMLATAEATAK